MEDRCIVDWFWARDERALNAAREQYGAYCCAIARRILGDERDAEESLNSTLHAAWQSIPPHRPQQLRSYLAKLARRISLDARRRQQAQKRGGGVCETVLEELEECLAGGETPETAFDRAALAEGIRGFLHRLSADERRVFLLRYWHLYSIDDVAVRCGFSRSKTTSMLYRTRLKLKNHLHREELL